jgi:hypothetical protein
MFLRAALPLAAVVGFLTSIQSGLGVMLLLPAGIFFTVAYYGRRHSASPTAWQGAKQGLLVGLLSFAFFALFFTVESAVDVPAYRQAMEKLAHDMMARQPTPESQQLAQQWFGGPRAVEFVTAMVVTSTFFLLLVVGGITGALAGALSKRRRLH